MLKKDSDVYNFHKPASWFWTNCPYRNTSGRYNRVHILLLGCHIRITFNNLTISLRATFSC